MTPATPPMLHFEWVDPRASCEVVALENTESANEDESMPRFPLLVAPAVENGM
jgi:hypothetical protein